MGLLAALMMYAVAFTLWMPGVALFNVAGAWGVQPALIFSLILVALMIGLPLSRLLRPRRMNVKSEWAAYHAVYIAVALVCTVITTAGLTKSAETLAAELMGWSFSLTMTWWFCRDRNYLLAFLKGYKFAGIVFCFYGIYQLIGLPKHLPGAYLPLNNASFSLMDPLEAASFGRAYGLTSEPSIFACLLMPLVAILTIDVIAYGGIRRYFVWIVSILGYLSTSSQSVVIVPFFLLVVAAFVWRITKNKRAPRLVDILGFCALAGGGLGLVVSNSMIGYWLGRVADPSSNVSAQTRLGDLIVGMRMFTASPIFGQGLGSSSMQMDSFMMLTGVHETSGGITSGLLRVLAEEGLVGAFALVVGAICIIPRHMVRGLSRADAVLLASEFAFVLAMIIQSVVFAGYRNTYQIWLIFPMGLAMKSQIKALIAARAPAFAAPSAAQLQYSTAKVVQT